MPAPDRMYVVASVTRNDGILVRTVRKPFTQPTAVPKNEAGQKSEHKRPTLVDGQIDHQHPGCTHDGADGQIELAGNEQQRHRDGDDSDLGGDFEVVDRAASSKEAGIPGSQREEDEDADRADDRRQLRAE